MFGVLPAVSKGTYEYDQRSGPAGLRGREAMPPREAGVPSQRPPTSHRLHQRPLADALSPTHPSDGTLCTTVRRAPCPLPGPAGRTMNQNARPFCAGRGVCLHCYIYMTLSHLVVGGEGRRGCAAA